MRQIIKSAVRPCSQYCQDALALLGQLIREGRLSKSMTTTELALRAGISRSLLQRIERGDPACSIGSVFEVAAICGVQLFELNAPLMTQRLAQQQEKLRLLPKAVRSRKKVVQDDF